MLTHVDLFSGIGGFALAAQRTGFRTIAFCERDEWCQRVLAKNFGAVVVQDSVSNGLAGEHEAKRATIRQQRDSGAGSGEWIHRAPIFPDVRTFPGSEFTGATLLTGGFPCQPFSCAGKRKGVSDDRALWPAMLAVIKDARPRWIIGENVPGIISMELDTVLSDLEGAGYTVRPIVLPACATDAPHRRDRVWIVAYSEDTDGRGTNRENYSRWWDSETRGRRKCYSGSQHWLPEPNVGRVAHGVSRRVDRLRGLGNAIVPQVAEEIMRMIAALETPVPARGNVIPLHREGICRNH